MTASALAFAWRYDASGSPGAAYVALGLIPLKNLAEIEAHYAKRDVDFHARVDELTATYAAPGEPDASYLQAKANAEAVMNPFTEAEAA